MTSIRRSKNNTVRDHLLLLLGSNLLLCLCNRGSVGLWPTCSCRQAFQSKVHVRGNSKRTTKHRGDLEWSFEVALGCFPEYMNSNNFCIIQVLQAHKSLDEEGLSVLHVYMEEGHHGDAKVRAPELHHKG